MCRDVKKKKICPATAAIIHDKWNLGHGCYSCLPALLVSRSHQWASNRLKTLFLSTSKAFPWIPSENRGVLCTCFWVFFERGCAAAGGLSGTEPALLFLSTFSSFQSSLMCCVVLFFLIALVPTHSPTCARSCGSFSSVLTAHVYLITSLVFPLCSASIKLCFYILLFLFFLYVPPAALHLRPFVRADVYGEHVFIPGIFSTLLPP